MVMNGFACGSKDIVSIESIAGCMIDVSKRFLFDLFWLNMNLKV